MPKITLERSITWDEFNPHYGKILDMKNIDAEIAEWTEKHKFLVKIVMWLFNHDMEWMMKIGEYKVK